MKIGIIGCGNMGAAFGRRLASHHDLYFFDSFQKKAAELAIETGGISCDRIETLTEAVEVIILAIKPKDLSHLGEMVTFKKHQIIISMLSGVTIEDLSAAFGEEAALVRIMPNLPVQSGLGVIGAVIKEEGELRLQLETLLAPLGLLIWIPESMIDSLTPLSGCGPAFFFLIVEACIEAGIALGFGAMQAKELVLQTFKGSLRMLEESDKTPGELKWQVTSPGGDTIRGLCEMERRGLKSALIDGILKAKPSH